MDTKTNYVRKDFDMKWKTIVGIVLVIASILAMYLWETRFKEEITQIEVLVPAADIKIGEKVLLSSFKSIKINPLSKVDKALLPKDVDSIVGKIAKEKLYENQQLVSMYFASKEEILPDGYVDFVIPSDWIYSKSSLIGLKDTVKIYAMPGRTYLGTYKIDIVGQSFIEIIARLEDYFDIYDRVALSNEKLLLVMDEDV